MHLTRYWFCIKCKSKFAPEKAYYVCPNPGCGGLLKMERDLSYLKKKFPTPEAFRNHFDSILLKKRKRYPWDSGVFRWSDAILPGFPVEHMVSLHEGNTDLFEPPDWLKKEIGFNGLWIKLEGRAPTESFKDRGMPVAISEALRLQETNPEIKFVCCASTGDTSASAAAYAGYVRDRLGCIVLVPQGKISPAQMYQALSYGAIVLALKAPGFDQCMDVVQKFSANHPEMVLVNSKNAMRLVGQETISLEIFQEFGKNGWEVPDALVIPIGNAGNASAQMSAWWLLKNLGVIRDLPKIILAQTEKANTIVRWIRSDFTDYSPGEPKETQASAMNIQNPVSFPRIKFFRELGFEIHGYDVSEPEISRTRAQFDRSGVGLCPQGAVAVNAALQALDEEVIRPDDQVVAISTASSTKFVDSGFKHHMEGSLKDFANRPILVEPNISAVERAASRFL